MTLKRFALDYSKCSVEELQGFMRARGIKPRKSKAACINALERADRITTFPFEKLSGELRNMVYHELLLLPKDEDDTAGTAGEWRKCCPQILATSSIIHDEASGILYSVNDFTARIIVRVSSKAGISGDMRYSLATYPLPNTFASDDYMVRARNCASSLTVRRFQRIHIHLHTKTIDGYIFGQRNPEFVSTCLQSLVSSMQGSTALTTVVITGDTRDGSALIDETVLSRALYPLSRLCANFKCRFQGFEGFENLVQNINLTADDNADVYKIHGPRKAMLVREESDTYGALAKVTANRANSMQHVKLCAEMRWIFTLTQSNPKEERILLDWTETMAAFLDKAYEAEARPVPNKASGFWLEALKDFDKAHRARVEEFPSEAE